jgi:hypothetical protein
LRERCRATRHHDLKSGGFGESADPFESWPPVAINVDILEEHAWGRTHHPAPWYSSLYATGVSCVSL